MIVSLLPPNNSNPWSNSGNESGSASVGLIIQIIGYSLRFGWYVRTYVPIWDIIYYGKVHSFEASFSS